MSIESDTLKRGSTVGGMNGVDEGQEESDIMRGEFTSPALWALCRYHRKKDVQ